MKNCLIKITHIEKNQIKLFNSYDEIEHIEYFINNNIIVEDKFKIEKMNKKRNIIHF